MHVTVLDSIPFEIDTDGFLELLRLTKEHKLAREALELCAEAVRVGKPKAMYVEAEIGSREEEGVVIEGVHFHSRLLSINTADTHTVYPFVFTCGIELERWSNQFDDILEQFWADSIKGMALGAALKAFDEHLGQSVAVAELSSMNPGSLEDWSIEEQRRLFQLLGDVTGAIGVSLTESCMMMPIKSLSGIRFYSKEAFVNCQLCDREKCPGRRAPFDEHPGEIKYGCRDMGDKGGA